MRIIDHKQPCSIPLFTDHLGTHASRRDFDCHSRRRLDHPACMQYRQAPRFNSRTRFERHPATNRQGALVRLPYALVAYHLVSINEQNRIGLVERDQSFDIAAVESLKEESMDFDGGLRGHLVRPLSDVRTLCANIQFYGLLSPL